MILTTAVNNSNPEVTDRITRKNHQNFQFLETIPNAYFCVVCKNLLNDPVQTFCGCRYCRLCMIEHLFEGSSYCYSGFEDCQNELLNMVTNVRTDAAANRFIKNLKVKCDVKECDYVTTYENIDSHWDECLFVLVECDQCKRKLTRKRLPLHIKNECENRNEICKFCVKSFPNEMLNLIHYNIHHRDLCVKYLCVCPYNCGKKGEVVLVEHRKVCSSKPNLCPFVEVGCDYLHFTLELSSHIECSSINHFSFITHKLSLIEVSLNELYSEAHSERSYLKILKDSFDFDRDSSGLLSKLETLLRIRNNPVKPTVNEFVFRNGNYIWHIKHFSDLKNEAETGRTTSICSEPFLTSEFGYKLCMKIYPCGDGLGKQTHLSVFFSIMRGDYDQALVWPFKNKITLSILDQVKKTNNYSESFLPDSKSICFEKPKTDSNIATGSPKFITFTDLKSYIVNDSFFLKISVGN